VSRVVEFVRIVNPKQPGEFLVLAKDDFDPAVHTLFVETPADPEPATEPEPTVTSAPTKPTRVRKPKGSSTPEVA
jgi:hypothetical protein